MHQQTITDTVVRYRKSATNDHCHATHKKLSLAWYTIRQKAANIKKMSLCHTLNNHQKIAAIMHNKELSFSCCASYIADTLEIINKKVLLCCTPTNLLSCTSITIAAVLYIYKYLFLSPLKKEENKSLTGTTFYRRGRSMK